MLLMCFDYRIFRNLKYPNKIQSMELEEQNKQNSQVFRSVFASEANLLAIEQILAEDYFTQSSTSNNPIILTLTKRHIIVRNASSNQSEKMFIADIAFDLKFETIYQIQKNVSSQKVGIKFLSTNTDGISFYSVETITIERWISHLAKLINQKGFHEIFKPLKKLGKGNFASVYEVERITDLKRFAVKAFSKQTTFAAKNGKQSLMNELSVMRTLNHSNILKLQCVFESQNSIYVVLEVLKGCQLYHKIQQRKGQFKKTQIKTFMKGLLQGLAHMHSHRIMHRDLKPQNIMLRDNQCMDPVIVDFGLATNVDIDKYLFYRCGTPGYVAPQIVSINQNAQIEPECDIFSAGVIFHILLLRKPLFEGTRYDQVYRNNKILSFDLSAPIYQTLTKQELNLLEKMLTINPKKRITASQALKNSYFYEQKIIQEFSKQAEKKNYQQEQDDDDEQFNLKGSHSPSSTVPTQKKNNKKLKF